MQGSLQCPVDEAKQALESSSQALQNLAESQAKLEAFWEKDMSLAASTSSPAYVTCMHDMHA